MGNSVPDAKLINANGENEAKISAEWLTLEVAIECSTLEIPANGNH